MPTVNPPKRQALAVKTLFQNGQIAVIQIEHLQADTIYMVCAADSAKVRIVTQGDMLNADDL